MDRAAQLQRWLETALGSRDFGITPASDDASFRRYFRVRRGGGQASLIAMDAPPEKEDCRPFVHVTRIFADAGVHVPAIHAQALDQGFLLLSDLGDTTYLGASVPVDSLVALVVRQRPTVVALSATIAPHVPRVRDAIAAIRGAALTPAPLLIVGGRALSADPTLAQKIGADLVAHDAAEAVDLLQARFGLAV